MQLIRALTVRNFRSISDVTLSGGHLTSLVGANGSGKSNLLRALNLFFNGEVEPGLQPEFSRDFHKPWRSTKNRYIEVDVRFELPAEFSIRAEIAEPLTALGITPEGRFTIRKHWERDQTRDEAVDETVSLLLAHQANYRMLSADEARAFSRFLRLVKFRYIPNHIHPSELLAAENAALQEELLRAVRRELRRAEERVDLDALLTVVSDAAKALVAPVTSVLQASPNEVQALEVTTPGDWGEVIWSLALKLQGSEPRSLDVGLHGSGNQTFLMYVLTHFLDTRFSQEFGWHQATIWAIEEPESFLHADLRNQLNTFLTEITSTARFQVFLTTHELPFAAASDQRYRVSIEKGATAAQTREVLALAEEMLATGVTPFVHPLNLTPPKPTLLVDGPYDVFYWTTAYLHSERTNPWDIRSLPDIDPGVGGGGKNTIKKYLAQNAGPLRARPAGSPVVVLLDWEDTEAERQSVEALLTGHPTSRAILCPVDRVNPDLGESFKGIERFLATELVHTVAATDPGLGIVRGAGGVGAYELMPQTSDRAKQALVRRCRDRELAADTQLLSEALVWLESHLPASETPESLPGV
jgi:energy-coupling factor transporter ATP-binding protein EcfA2